MADEKTTQGKKTEAGQAKGEPGSDRDPQLEQDLREELNRLGKSFVEVVQVAWDSEQRRRVEQDLKSGLNSLAANLEDGFKKVSESPQSKEFVNKAEDVAGSVAERVRNSEVAQEIGEGLLKGLRALGAQLDKLTSELQTKNSPKGGSASSAKAEQDVPVSKG